MQTKGSVCVRLLWYNDNMAAGAYHKLEWITLMSSQLKLYYTSMGVCLNMS